MSVLELSDAAVNTSVATAPSVGTGREQAHANPRRLFKASPRIGRLGQVMRALSGRMDADEAVVEVDAGRTQDGTCERLARCGLWFGC